LLPDKAALPGFTTCSAETLQNRYLVHEWRDGCVVFDRATGDTHALDVIAGEVFRASLEGQAALDLVENIVRSTFPDIATPELDARLRAARERLAQAGLFDSGLL